MSKNTKWVSASRAWSDYGVTRAWLRSRAESGEIRKRTINGTNDDGTPFVRFMYAVDDINSVLDGE